MDTKLRGPPKAVIVVSNYRKQVTLRNEMANCTYSFGNVPNDSLINGNFHAPSFSSRFGYICNPRNKKALLDTVWIN